MFPADRRLELVPQGRLDLPCGVQATIRRAVKSKSRSPESWIPGLWSTTTGSKYVSVKCIGEVKLKRDHMILPYGSSLDDGKILAQIARASPVSECCWQVSVDKPSPRTNGQCARINQGGAIDDGSVVP